VAQQARGIDPLLDHFFSFLRRKTDFFSGVDESKYETAVLNAVRKHASLSQKDDAEKKLAREKEAVKAAARVKKPKEPTAAEKAIAKAKADKAAAAAQVAADGAHEAGSEGFDLDGSDAAAAGAAAMPPAPPDAAAAAKAADGGEDDGDESDHEPPPPGNGGITDEYVWTQKLDELNLVVPVPPGTKSRDIIVTIKNKTLKVGLKGKEPVLDGELHARYVDYASHYSSTTTAPARLLLLPRPPRHSYYTTTAAPTTATTTNSPTHPASLSLSLSGASSTTRFGRWRTPARSPSPSRRRTR
jgi:hypothetical protein